MKIGLYLAKI